MLARPAERWEGRYRSELCGGGEGFVLEIGAGTGMNFSHDATVWGVVAIEPEPRMLAQAKRRAARRVLKADGSVRFYEHVRARGDRAARWQDRLERPW